MLFIRRIIFRNFSSNFKPANKIRVRSDTFQNVLSTNLKDIDWHSVRKELIESERFINALNLDGIIIEKCNKDIRLDVAKSYINFLKSQSFVINDVSVSKLLRLFYRHHRKINQEYEEEKFHISEEDEAEIIKFSKSLMEKHQVLDASIAENIIHGLSLTREWTKCIDLLRHIKVTSTPSTSTYSAIILKALEEKELDITWNIINEMFSKQIVPSIIVLLKYFRMFERDDVMTEKMFEAMRDNSLLLPEKVINYYKNVFNTTRDCKIVKIGKNGNCPSCNNKLSTMKLNETEFMKLSNTFLDNVMIRRDIFIKTSPDELKRFKDFIDRAIPFDCVIDGLNVAYSHGTDQPVKMFVKNIASAVKYFVDRNQTCLVIGRNHMRKWPKDKMDYIRRNSSLFLADNMSQDDPFMLYAALKSGPQTKIFSRDLMRGHSTLLDIESKKLFRRWQLQNQYSLITTFKNQEILVQEPVDFELQAHKINSVWHIPFTSENLNFTYESFEVPSSWLCVKL